MISIKHSDYMKQALVQAKIAYELLEVPVGAVIVKDDKIISRGYNSRESDKNALGHAEIMAINEACKKLCSWRLSGCRLYVTLEPCPMCMGAIINSRLDTVIFGANDFKAGCCGSVIDLTAYNFNHHVKIIGGINEEECQKILVDFFKNFR